MYKWTDQESGGNWLPTGKWIGFTDCLTGLFDGRTYYVGIAGDNHFRLRLDGDIIVDTRETNSPYLPSNDRAFKIWNVYPVVIGSGDHNLELFGYNNSSFAGFGCEIYDNTFEELTGATSLSDINIIYSAVDRRHLPSFRTPMGLTTQKVILVPMVINTQAVRMTVFRH